MLMSNLAGALAFGLVRKDRGGLMEGTISVARLIGDVHGCSGSGRSARSTREITLSNPQMARRYAGLSGDHAGEVHDRLSLLDPFRVRYLRCNEVLNQDNSLHPPVTGGDRVGDTCHVRRAISPDGVLVAVRLDEVAGPASTFQSAHNEVVAVAFCPVKRYSWPIAASS